MAKTGMPGGHGGPLCYVDEEMRRQMIKAVEAVLGRSLHDDGSYCASLHEKIRGMEFHREVIIVHESKDGEKIFGYVRNVKNVVEHKMAAEIGTKMRRTGGLDGQIAAIANKKLAEPLYGSAWERWLASLVTW